MPDSVPNYLTVSPGGEVSAVFPGGVEVLAGTNSSPPDERQVRWVRESDGALVAQVYGYETNPGAFSTGAAGIFAQNPDSAGFNAGLVLLATNGVGVSRVAQAGVSINDTVGPVNRFMVLLDRLNRSDTMRLRGKFASVDYDNCATLSGVVQGNGTAIAGYPDNIQVGVTGYPYSVVRNAVGNYTVTYSRPFVRQPVVTLAVQGAGAFAIALTASTINGFIVQVFNANNGASLDGQFNFQVVGGI